MKTKTLEEAVARYGTISNGVWSGENKWMKVVHMPSWFQIEVDNNANGKDCEKIYMNRDLEEPLLAALQNLVNEGCYEELNTFDGCWMVRDKRGMTGHPSVHSFGLAIDFNAGKMPLGSESVWSDKFVKCFTDVGFVWGGNFKRKDPMHFQWAMW